MSLAEIILRGEGNMPAVYFYVPTEELEDVIDCGLKLSEWKSKQQETPWNAIKRPCFTACLHPNDDIRHKDKKYQCVKLNISADDCAIADLDLYFLSLEHSEISKEYINTMTPFQNYRFGSFRRPECLIFTTVLSDQIKCFGKSLDEPILYENSAMLYVNNIIETYNDRFDNVSQALLYSFLTLQDQAGLVSCFRSDHKGLAVFYGEDRNKHITVQIPDLSKYR